MSKLDELMEKAEGKSFKASVYEAGIIEVVKLEDVRNLISEAFVKGVEQGTNREFYTA